MQPCCTAQPGTTCDHRSTAVFWWFYVHCRARKFYQQPVIPIVKPDADVFASLNGGLLLAPSSKFSARYPCQRSYRQWPMDRKQPHKGTCSCKPNLIACLPQP